MKIQIILQFCQNVQRYQDASNRWFNIHFSHLCTKTHSALYFSFGSAKVRSTKTGLWVSGSTSSSGIAKHIPAATKNDNNDARAYILTTRVPIAKERGLLLPKTIHSIRFLIWIWFSFYRRIDCVSGYRVYQFKSRRRRRRRSHNVLKRSRVNEYTTTVKSRNQKMRRERKKRNDVNCARNKKNYHKF